MLSTLELSMTLNWLDTQVRGTDFSLFISGHGAGLISPLGIRGRTWCEGNEDAHRKWKPWGQENLTPALTRRQNEGCVGELFRNSIPVCLLAYCTASLLSTSSLESIIPHI